VRGGPPDEGERGSATVWTVALAGVLALVGVAVVLVGAAVVARHRAGAAADLAALAAAGAAVQGDPRACAVAGELAAANAATLDSCAVGAGAVVELYVHVPVRLGPLGVLDARARARAGPAPPDAEAAKTAPPPNPARDTRGSPEGLRRGRLLPPQADILVRTSEPSWAYWPAVRRARASKPLTFVL